jgi:asparagine synthase (glutamine-hydrolysing)
VERWELAHHSIPTQHFGTGTTRTQTTGRIGVAIQPYVSHGRSEMDSKPLSDLSENILCFDGRLDNYAELAQTLGIEMPDPSDSEIVLAAFSRWGEGCFSRFIGDWAVALWSRPSETLYLARDHAGTRTLYFHMDRGVLLWSSALDTFLTAERGVRLSEDYVACYLAGLPIRELTPYDGVVSVLPGHYVQFRDGGAHQYAHWNASSAASIAYQTDDEYEDHFLSLFQRAVARRTGPVAPILAQLSGGMDSTSIVCVSDHLRRSVDAEAEILDTVSFYDDSEDSLNERAYFSVTETKRGKVGEHIDTGFSARTFEPHDPQNGQYFLPGADSHSIVQEREFYDKVWSRGYRSILSGIGGDELLGGIPLPWPELADYLIGGSVRTLLRQSIAWSLVDHSPLIDTLFGTLRYTARLYKGSELGMHQFPGWLSCNFLKRSQKILLGRTTPFWDQWTEPRRLSNDRTWGAVLETLPHLVPTIVYRPEFRYPFLDRDLVDFLFAIPRHQILRPGRRRFLMRRALRNLVPQEILERRRKAFQLRAPLNSLRQAHAQLDRLFSRSRLADAGFVDPDALRLAAKQVALGAPDGWQALLRAIALELWLQSNHWEKGHHFRINGSIGGSQTRLVAIRDQQAPLASVGKFCLRGAEDQCNTR